MLRENSEDEKPNKIGRLYGSIKVFKSLINDNYKLD